MTIRPSCSRSRPAGAPGGQQEVVGDIGTLSMDEEHVANSLIEDEFITRAPAVSPDGRWIAYDSNLSGQFEIYIQRFPELGDRRRISRNGGLVPRWGPDGAELFYLSLDGRQLLAVPIEAGPTFRAGTPELIVEGAYLRPFLGSQPYDVDPDGERFVMISAASDGDDARPEIILVLNWFEELQRLVPTP